MGSPVKFIPFSTLDEERMLIEKGVRLLVSQGVLLKKIQILSPHIRTRAVWPAETAEGMATGGG